MTQNSADDGNEKRGMHMHSPKIDFQSVANQDYAESSFFILLSRLSRAMSVRNRSNALVWL